MSETPEKWAVVAEIQPIGDLISGPICGSCGLPFEDIEPHYWIEQHGSRRRCCHLCAASFTLKHADE